MVILLTKKQEKYLGVNMIKILKNRIISVKDVSENNNFRISIKYTSQDRIYYKTLTARKTYHNNINKQSNLYVFLKNFKEAFYLNDEIVVHNKLNYKLLNQIANTNMHVAFFINPVTKKGGYYDYYIAFNEKQITKMLQKLNDYLIKKELENGEEINSETGN